MATKAPPVAFRLTPAQMFDVRAVAKAEGLSPGQLAARLVADYVEERTDNVLAFRRRPTPEESEANHPSKQDDRSARIQAVLASLNADDHTDAIPPPPED